MLIQGNLISIKDAFPGVNKIIFLSKEIGFLLRQVAAENEERGQSCGNGEFIPVAGTAKTRQEK